MGYGNGHGSRHDRGGNRYNNSQTAHVWNAQTEKRGQSNNGNFYFEGPALYSYGSHFLVGYIMPDGVALLNESSYSVSTSSHQADARRAVTNRATCHIVDLTKLETLLRTITRGNVSKDYACTSLFEHAESLASATVLPIGAYRWEWNGELGKSVKNEAGESAGAYLARLCKLRAGSWPKLERHAAKAKAKRIASDKKANADAAKALAIRLADMPDAEFSRLIATADRDGQTYNAKFRIERHGLELHRAIRLANKIGLSNKRRAKLSARYKLTRLRLADIDRLTAIAEKRSSLRRTLAYFRDDEKWWNELEGAPDYHNIRALERMARNLTALAESLAFPLASRERMRAKSVELDATGEKMMIAYHETEATRRKEEERVRALEFEAFKAAWLAGEVPLSGRRFDSEHGGAAIRIRGKLLETSHGAAVPLADAVRVFRFVKLVMRRGEAWKRNGQTIRVGAFSVDSIAVDGSFVAGCHSFAASEVMNAARIAGVIDAEPSAEVVTQSEYA